MCIRDRVYVYNYVTESTFDAYLYQTLENKQKFISQIMTSKSPMRSCDDIDEQALSYACLLYTSSSLNYTKIGDYQLPNLTLSQPKTPLGKYGRMRLSFLRPVSYTHLRKNRLFCRMYRSRASAALPVPN